MRAALLSLNNIWTRSSVWPCTYTSARTEFTNTIYCYAVHKHLYMMYVADFLVHVADTVHAAVHMIIQHYRGCDFKTQSVFLNIQEYRKIYFLDFFWNICRFRSCFPFYVLCVIWQYYCSGNHRFWNKFSAGIYNFNFTTVFRD